LPIIPDRPVNSRMSGWLVPLLWESCGSTLPQGQTPMLDNFAKNDLAWMQARRREAMVGGTARSRAAITGIPCRQFRG
jgi:hypothetical protein